MGLLKTLYNFLNEESEEGRQNRLAREKEATDIRVVLEKASAEQKEYLNNMKCPICGNNQFKKSIVNTTSAADHGHSVKEIRSYYESDDEEFLKIYEVNSMMCLHCGYIVNFADIRTERKSQISLHF